MIFLIVEKVISVVFLPSGSAPPYSYRAPPPRPVLWRNSGLCCHQSNSDQPAPPPPGMCVHRGEAQTMDSVSTSPCRPSFRDSVRTVGFWLPSPPSPDGWEDRPFCSSLASSDTSG